VEAAKDCLRKARSYGVNLFDNAETYGDPAGEAERIMGLAIKSLQLEDPVTWRRSDLIITTKLFWGGNGVNERGLSKKHIDEGIDKSLARLQLSYVDLLFCHRPDPFTPTETVVRAMTDVVRSGKVCLYAHKLNINK
jgi:aryl-alcohol dehydrogenase-like predicted oxidoreductase